MSKTIAPVTESDYLKAYRIMLTSRVLEEKLASLYRAGMIKGGVFLGRGHVDKCDGICRKLPTYCEKYFSACR